MFRLSREVRFAVNPLPGAAAGASAGAANAAASGRPANAFAGHPPMLGLGHHFALTVTVEGDLDPASQYLLNIKLIDAVAREHALPLVERAVRSHPPAAPALLIRALFDRLTHHLPARVSLAEARLALTPYLSVAARRQELPMTRLSQRFEFSASHRLHNPALSDEENRRTFGKCNNPHGHGHNYEVQVTIKGDPDEATGLLVDVAAFERLVAETVIDRFDHRHLNTEVPEFRTTIPSVENIARVIYRLLAPRLADPGLTTGRRAALASVTVWETTKTWCEYSED